MTRVVRVAVRYMFPDMWHRTARVHVCKVQSNSAFATNTVDKDMMLPRRSRNNPSQVTHKASNEVMMAARGQLAEQQQELDRLRQETYILKEAHQIEHFDSSLQQQVADLQKTVSTYKQQLEASPQQVSTLHQQLGTSQQQLQSLHQQLTGSQQQVLSLNDQISTLQQRSEPQGTLSTKSQSKPGQLSLEPVSHEGAHLHVDTVGKHVYAAQPTGLHRVGSWTEQRGVQLTQSASPAAAALAQLQDFVKTQQHQLQEFFNKHAQDSSGSIPIQLLSSLLSSLLPAASADDLLHIQSMLAVGSAGKISLPNLLAAFEASVVVTDAAAAAEAAIPHELSLLSAAIQQQHSQLCDLFEAQAGSLSGNITCQQLTHMLKRLVGGITVTQLRCLLAKLHAQGVRSHISLQDVYSSLQLHLAPKVLSATHLRSSVSASPKAPAAQTSAASVELHALRRQLAQASQAAQHQAQACSNKDAELVLLQRAVKQLQQDLHMSRQQEAAASASHTAQASNEALEVQIRAAGDKAHVLKTRFLETKSAFEQLKTQHARVVQVACHDMLTFF